jgi:hypothetical protein
MLLKVKFINSVTVTGQFSVWTDAANYVMSAITNTMVINLTWKTNLLCYVYEYVTLINPMPTP